MKTFEIQITEVIRHVFYKQAATREEAIEHANKMAEKLTIEQPGYPKNGRVGYAAGCVHVGCHAGAVRQVEDAPVEPEG